MVLFVIAVILLTFGVVVFVGAPYVPSLKKDVTKAFDGLYPLSENDVVLDVGSGDGKVLRAAAQRGARAVGYEINPFLVVISLLLGIGNSRVNTRLQNMWTATFPVNTTLVYVFAVSRDTVRISRKIQREADRIGKDIYVMSYGAKIPGAALQRAAGAHHLYLYKALHNKKPQV